MAEKKGRKSQDLKSERGSGTWDNCLLRAEARSFNILIHPSHGVSSFLPSLHLLVHVGNKYRSTSEPQQLPKTLVIEEKFKNWTQNPLILNPGSQLAIECYISSSWVLDLQVSCHTHPSGFWEIQSLALILAVCTTSSLTTKLSPGPSWVLFVSVFVLFCSETCSPGLPQILLLLACAVLGLQVWGTTRRPEGFLALFLGFVCVSP